MARKAGKAEFDAAREKLEATGSFDKRQLSLRAFQRQCEDTTSTYEVSEVGQLYPIRFDALPATDAQLRAWLKQKDPLFEKKIPATKPVVDRYVAWISEYLGEARLSPAVAAR